MSPRNADHHEPDDPDIAQAMRARREELGLSVSQMSERAGVSAQTWRNYESGRSRVRADKQDSVWDALGWELPSPWSAQCGVVVGELGELGARSPGPRSGP